MNTQQPTKTTGLTHAEYQKISHLQFPDAIADEPQSTPRAAAILRTRGYAATTDKLKKMVRNGTLPAVGQQGRERAWTPERIDAAAEHFETTNDFTPEAAFCKAWEITYGDWWAELRKAYRKAVREFGSISKREIGYEPDPVHFELHATQARTENEKAKIWWTLRGDVRKKIANHIEQGA